MNECRSMKKEGRSEREGVTFFFIFINRRDECV